MKFKSETTYDIQRESALKERGKRKTGDMVLKPLPGEYAWLGGRGRRGIWKCPRLDDGGIFLIKFTEQKNQSHEESTKV